MEVADIFKETWEMHTPAPALDPFTEPSVKARICSGNNEDILLAKS